MPGVYVDRSVRSVVPCTYTINSTPDCENTNERSLEPARSFCNRCMLHTPKVRVCTSPRSGSARSFMCAPPGLSVCLSVAVSLRRPAGAGCCRRRDQDGQVRPRRSADPSHHVLEEPGILPHCLRRQGLLQQPRVRGTWQRPMRHLVHLHPGLVWCKGDPSAKTRNPKTGVMPSSTPRLTTRQHWRARDLSMRCERPHDETPFRQISQTSTRKLQAGGGAEWTRRRSLASPAASVSAAQQSNLLTACVRARLRRRTSELD